MALVLSVGLVVDDAIVVVENIIIILKTARNLFCWQLSKVLRSRFCGNRHDLSALVMVFLPISFMDGMAGLLFTEFSVLLAISVVFIVDCTDVSSSTFSGKLLKANVQPNRFNKLVDRLFAALSRRYRELLSRCMGLRWGAPFFVLVHRYKSVFGSISQTN